MRMGADDGTNMAAGGVVQALQMIGIVGPRVDHRVAGGGVPDQVAVGARPGHHAGVRSSQAHYVFEQTHRGGGLPVKRVGELPDGADQRQLAEWRAALHEPRLNACQPARTRAGGPQRCLACARRQHRIHRVEPQQSLQRTQRRKDHQKITRLVPHQRLRRADPAGFELLTLVGHSGLVSRHAGDQKRHIETLGQVAVGDPVRQHKHLSARQRQAACGALVGQRQRGRHTAVHCSNVLGGGPLAASVPG